MIGTRTIRPMLPTRVLYTLALFFVSILLIAFAWFTVHYFLVIVQPITSAVATNIGSDDATYLAVDTFFSGLDNWLGIIAFLALIIGVYQYSQRRGRMI